MEFSDHEGGSTLVHPEIAERVIEALKQQIDTQLTPPESENLHTHLFYLAMSITLLMKANEPENMDNEMRRAQLKKVLYMVREIATVWYISDEADAET